MGKFIVIGERISTTAPSMNKALTERDPEPIIKRAKEQIAAGADYIDVNIGPAESDGEDPPTHSRIPYRLRPQPPGNPALPQSAEALLPD